MNCRPRITCLVGCLGATLVGVTAFSASVTEDVKPPLVFKLPDTASFGATPAQIDRALRPVEPPAWKPAVNQERERGAEEIYARVAPSTVVVRTPQGHGSGVVIDPAGWVLTNHHVIEDGGHDPATGALAVTVHVGRLGKDGLMQLVEDSLPALVYKASEAKDLALVRVLKMPAGMKELPAVKLAAQAPRPGSECVVLGHPTAGVLWTVRRGEVAGAGVWPRETIDAVMRGLALPKVEHVRLEAMFATVAPRKVLLSTCLLNPGDSGGPVVNPAGELVGVSFGMPRSRGERRVDRFSYHVHLDEVREFLKDRPGKPAVHVPDPWPPGVLVAPEDLDGDGTTDTLVFGTAPGEPATGYLFDLAQASPKLSAAELARLDQRGKWNFTLAVHMRPVWRAFYDTKQAGQVDLVLIRPSSR